DNSTKPGPIRKWDRVAETRANKKKPIRVALAVQHSALPLSYRPVESGGEDSNLQPLGFQPNCLYAIAVGYGPVSLKLGEKSRTSSRSSFHSTISNKRVECRS